MRVGVGQSQTPRAQRYGPCRLSLAVIRRGSWHSLVLRSVSNATRSVTRSRMLGGLLLDLGLVRLLMSRTQELFSTSKRQIGCNSCSPDSMSRTLTFHLSAQSVKVTGGFPIAARARSQAGSALSWPSRQPE